MNTTLKITSSNHRISNENDNLRNYKISANVVVSSTGEITLINSGNVTDLEDKQLCSFNNRHSSVHYDFKDVDVEKQKDIIEKITDFIENLKSINFNLN